MGFFSGSELPVKNTNHATMVQLNSLPYYDSSLREGVIGAHCLVTATSTWRRWKSATNTTSKVSFVSVVVCGLGEIAVKYILFSVTLCASHILEMFY